MAISLLSLSHFASRANLKGVESRGQSAVNSDTIWFKGLRVCVAFNGNDIRVLDLTQTKFSVRKLLLLLSFYRLIVSTKNSQFPNYTPEQKKVFFVFGSLNSQHMVCRDIVHRFQCPITKL